MPIYEYLCTDCAAVSEYLVFSDSESVGCAKCGSKKMKKLLSVTSGASGVKEYGRLPGSNDTACCGSRPASHGCIPGSCCGKA